MKIALIVKRLDEVNDLFKELAKEGYRTDKEDTFEDLKLLETIPMREYNLGPNLSVAAMVLSPREDGPSCRMEQVGVKEVPVYEMKCD